MKPLFPTYIIKKHAMTAMQGRFMKALCITAVPSLIIAAITAVILSLMPQVGEAFELIVSGNFESVAERATYIESVTYDIAFAMQAVAALFAFLNVGSIKACLDMLRGKEVKTRTIFSYYNKWYIALIYPVATMVISFLASALINHLYHMQVEKALVMTIAVIVDIIIYFIAFKLMFLDYTLADNGCTDIVAGVKAAWKMTGFNTVINAFILGVSFIGWFLLGVFTMGLAYIFVIPYFSLSVAALYEINLNYSHHSDTAVQ